MFLKLYNFWHILKSSLWFLPAVFCLSYFLFTIFIYKAEIAYFPEAELPGFFFSGSAEDAKTVTITLLSAMITMATLAISITMVVLSLAASQLGPRLIKSFMADRHTQNYIGLFFGSVIACFMLTIILHDAGKKAITPQVTISMVFTICFANLFVLLAFVNHVAEASIADNVIRKVAKDLMESMERLTITENKKTGDDIKDKNWPDDFDDKRARLRFERSGYVQHINYDSIVEIAKEQNLKIMINFKAGHFLVEGEDGVRIYPGHELDEDLETCIKACFIIGNTRTPTQDIEYSIRHLVEIAVRAASPGVNDNVTVINVLDNLSASMARLFKKEMPSEAVYDDDGIIRVRAKQSNEYSIIFSAFNQIRQSTYNTPEILRHTLSKFKILAELATSELQRDGLLEQLEAIEDNLSSIEKFIPDKKQLLKQCKELQVQLTKENEKSEDEEVDRSSATSNQHAA